MKIPDEARPVASILARDVPKPDYPASGRRSWNVKNGLGCCCPMGLHPAALATLPVSRIGFPPAASDSDVEGFWAWYDCLDVSDIPAAIDAIWEHIDTTVDTASPSC